MASFPAEVWALLGVVGASAVVASLHVLATTVRNETHLHDLRVEVVRKRNAYIRDLYGLAEDEGLDPDHAQQIETVHESAMEATEKLTELAERKAA